MRSDGNTTRNFWLGNTRVNSECVTGSDSACLDTVLCTGMHCAYGHSLGDATLYSLPSVKSYVDSGIQVLLELVRSQQRCGLSGTQL